MDAKFEMTGWQGTLGIGLVIVALIYVPLFLLSGLALLMLLFVLLKLFYGSDTMSLDISISNVRKDETKVADAPAQGERTVR